MQIQKKHYFYIDEQSSNNFVRCFENKTAFNIDEQDILLVRCFENKTAFNIDEQSSNNFVRCFENKTAFNIDEHIDEQV